jgi:hypothetical protein
MPPAAWLVNCMQDGGGSQTGATGGAIFLPVSTQSQLLCPCTHAHCKTFTTTKFVTMLQSSIASGPLQGTSNIRACTAVRATAWHTLPAPLLRRRIFLSSLMTVSPLVTLHTGVALAEEAPACATCLGNVDGTLGSCAGLEVCASR